ncbi:MAG TPA: hypothetical protein VGN09_11870 [Vicinamibacteria bacterium]
MRHLRVALAPTLALLAAAGLAQPPPTQAPPSPFKYPTPREQYGPAQPEELMALAMNPENYHRRNVVTRGYLDMLPDDRWLLSDGGAHLLLIPVVELSSAGLREQLGHRIEVTGIVRVLPDHQGSCCPRCQPPTPMSVCEDPALPALPDRSPEWPHGSITATGVVDIENYRAGESRRRVASTIADALARPPESAGKSVRIVGRFRGANLFGDLPAETRRAAGDWVLQDGEHAVWVTGRPPKGKGFDLDPGNKLDTGRWLEVEGKLEAMGNVGYLKASRVQLVARPAASSEEKR